MISNRVLAVKFFNSYSKICFFDFQFVYISTNLLKKILNYFNDDYFELITFLMKV